MATGIESGTWATASAFVKLIIPEQYHLFWTNKDIVRNNEHDIIHHIMLVGLVNKIGKYLIAQGVPVDLLAQDSSALTHDTQRDTDEPDTNHAQAAARFLWMSRDYFEPLSSFYKSSKRSLELANLMVLFHNLPFNDLKEKFSPEVFREHPGLEVNLRLFVFCDVLAIVRYNHWDGNFEVTPELLNQKLPGFFTEKQLKYLIKQTQKWHELAMKYKKKYGDVKKDHSNQIRAVIQAGIETGFFS